jgi:hypothetical protein
MPRNLTQVAAEHFIRAPEKIGRFHKLRRQVPPHPDRLCALPGKKERDFSGHAPDDAPRAVVFNPESD